MPCSTREWLQPESRVPIAANRESLWAKRQGRLRHTADPSKSAISSCPLACHDSFPSCLTESLPSFLSLGRQSCLLTARFTWTYSAFDSLIILWISIHVQSHTRFP